MVAIKAVALKTTPKVDRLDAVEATYVYWVDAAKK
jgi:hypothetical protein